MSMKKASHSLFNMGSPLNSAEGKLRREIKRGLRKNASVNITDGVVTGGGGDKVKGSGKGRRAVARKLASDITSGATLNDGNSFNSITVTANPNRSKNRVVTTNTTPGPTTSETRVNNKGTVISKNTSTTNTTKNIEKRPNKFRADYNIGFNKDEVDTRKTTFKPGSFTSRVQTTPEYTFIDKNNKVGSFGDMGGMKQSVSESISGMQQTVDNFGRGPMFPKKPNTSLFKMKGSPLNSSGHGGAAGHTHTSKTDQETLTGQGDRKKRTDTITTTEESTTNPSVTTGPKAHEIGGEKYEEYKREQSRCEKNPNAPRCSGFNTPPSTSTESNKSVDSSSTYLERTYNPGTEVESGQLTPASTSNQSAPDGTVIRTKDSSDKKIIRKRNKVEKTRKRLEEKEERIFNRGKRKEKRVNDRDQRKKEKINTKQAKNVSRGKCPPCNC